MILNDFERATHAGEKKIVVYKQILVAVQIQNARLVNVYAYTNASVLFGYLKNNGWAELFKNTCLGIRLYFLGK